ncbi:uncharacterized protein LOC126686421 isoform X1 [Mercurialis annua]|uniref:uncharacterized protein LOC126686421 isoform X1 n=1 Tax=Mercurialis annua TaxID=3986 RepID=UPI00215FC68A|nr:uncharacterized protein LOC126686421 isoform X1 [Mercurialis annua]
MADFSKQEDDPDAISSYLGLSFGLFLALLPTNSISLVQNQQAQIKELSARLFQAEEQLKQMKSRRKEDSKANARVVEIFASHRNSWQAEEKRLLKQIDGAGEEMGSLRARIQDLESERDEWRGRIQDLEREVGERDEMIGFMSRNAVSVNDEYEVEEDVSGGCGNRECYGGEEENFGYLYSQHFDGGGGGGDGGGGGGVGFSSDFLPSASKFWAEKASLWQDMHCESLESLYHMKHFVARRESPWKVDGESTGISSKLKLLEQELLKLENIGKTDPSKVPSLLRKQAKRYQALAGKIDELCRRMQASDPCEPTLSSEFRTQRQTEFLLEAFRLQQRASETGQKLMALQTEIGKSYNGDDLSSQAKVTARRCFDAIRNNLKEVQRNLEIWLARIMGDLEGILARDGASRARDYYVSRYPFAQ